MAYSEKVVDHFNNPDQNDLGGLWEEGSAPRFLTTVGSSSTTASHPVARRSGC